MIETETTEAAAVPASTRPAVAMQGYYNLPFLKRPTWGWEIALYFFLGGISAGAFILSAMADLFGRARHRNLVRKARYVSLATLLPCPPLLIKDLGRPAKFSHMLRVFKPHSPMNTGAWALFGYGQLTGAMVVLQSRKFLASRSQANVERGLSLATLPFALTILAYPGVLLSTTSTPVWSGSRFLGGLLGVSSFSAACDTLALVSAMDRRIGAPSRAALESIGLLSRVAEAVFLSAYARNRDVVAPVTRGRQAAPFWAGVVGAGLVLPALLRTRAHKPRNHKTALFGTVLSLAGSLALKWILVHAGRDSANDPAANRYASRRAA